MHAGRALHPSPRRRTHPWLRSCFWAATGFAAALTSCGPHPAPPNSPRAPAPEYVSASSPSGHVSATACIEPNAPDAPYGRLRIAIRLDSAGSAPQVTCAPVLRFEGGVVLGERCVIESAEVHPVRDRFEQPAGKRRLVDVAAQECTIALREQTPPGSPATDRPRRWKLALRAAEDGVAWRFDFSSLADDFGAPVAPGAILQEDSAFELPAASLATVLPLSSFASSHEGLYQTLPLEAIPAEWLMGVPALVHLPGGAWAAITEANLTNYAGMYLTHAPTPSPAGSGPTIARLFTRLSPLPGSPETAVRTPLPNHSPWRVVMLADHPGRFLESDFILALNEPCRVADASWIHPGKTTFPWWNGYIDPDAQARGIEIGLNTATTKYYIDFCAASGIPYHTLDGRGDQAWYGGPIQYAGADPTRAVDGLDLPEVLRYAKGKGVRLRLWLHWKAAHEHMARAFPLYRQWGVEGVMLDFMDRDDQEMVRWLASAVELAAQNQLTVSLHGVAQPTGLERTFPNLLTSEGVWNLEQNKWDKVGCTPEHELTTFFTRMVAGPMDFHQGGVRTVSADRYRPLWEGPLVIGSPTRTLASYVVLQNPLSMVADYPSAYAGRPEIGVIARIPSEWDDTRVLAGEVGSFIALARRSGSTWWLGAMTNQARRTEIPLAFLGPGRFDAQIFDDEPQGGAMRQHRRTVHAGDSISASFIPGGGLVIELTPISP